MSRRVSDLHRTAFVTGAGSGLGRAFAAMLAVDGVRVWGTSRDPQQLAARFSCLGGADGTPRRSAAKTGPSDASGAASARLHAVGLDLADAAGAEAAFLGAAREAGGGFDLVINNAGYGVFGEFTDVPADIWTAQLQAMVVSTTRLTHAAYRSLRQRGRGCLVNISSLGAEFPIPFMSGYNVAKAGLSALSESLIYEARATGVTVIDFRPGDYRTGFNDAMRRPEGGGAAPSTPEADRVWRRIDAMMKAAPPPERAAADLRRAILRGRSGMVRSGTFFQARLAPLLARAMPASVVRAVSAHYFK